MPFGKSTTQHLDTISWSALPRLSSSPCIFSSLASLSIITVLLRASARCSSRNRFTFTGKRVPHKYIIQSTVLLYEQTSLATGAPGGTRTHDSLLKRQILYRLSYWRIYFSSHFLYILYNIFYYISSKEIISLISIHTPLSAKFANAVIEAGRVVSMQTPALAFIACLG